MPTQNITLTRNQASNIEFNDANITANDKTWLVVEDNGGLHFILNTEKNGGSANDIEIVLSPKKYICKIKAHHTRNLPLTGVRYRLYRWTANETIETLYEGNVTVNQGSGTQEEYPKILSYKHITEYDTPPDVALFKDGDLIMVNKVIKMKDGNSWVNLIDGAGANEGTYYRYVKANGNNPAENGSQLLQTYLEVQAIASALNLNADKRFTIYVPAGTYTLPEPLALNAPFVDITSISGEMDVLIQGERIYVSADNVRVTGFNLIENQQFEVADNLPNIIIKNCKGGDGSFVSGIGKVASGTFINCIGGDYSFGGNGGIASGTFTNCTGGEHLFGGGGGTASGTFTNCTGGDYSFGGGGIASGTFTNCIGGYASFGAGGTASGTFNNCIGGDYSFGGNGGIASGTFTNCTGGEGSFGGDGGTASGYFEKCTTGINSFGADGTLSGRIVQCVTEGVFGTLSGSGKIYASIQMDGTPEFIDFQTA